MLKEILEAVDYEDSHFETKFMVDAGLNNETRQFIETNSPKDAIEKWVQLQRKEPMAVIIRVKNLKAAKEFYNWVHKNTEEVVKLIGKQGVYKTDYLYKELQAVNLQKSNFNDDGLHPFNYG